MKENKLQEIAKILHAVSGLYGQKLNPESAHLYINAISENSLEEIQNAFQMILDGRVEGEGRFFPLPATINRIIRPSVSLESKAVDLSNRICELITQHSVDDWEIVASKIGPVGIEIVRRMGGWGNLVKTPSFESLNFLRSQMKRQASASFDFILNNPQRRKEILSNDLRRPAGLVRLRDIGNGSTRESELGSIDSSASSGGHE